MSKRRLAVNPDPLKVVEARAGEPSRSEVRFVVCLLAYRGARLRASVHKDCCARAPQAGKKLASGATWSTAFCSRTKMNELVGEYEDAGIEVAVWCPTCRGWSVT